MNQQQDETVESYSNERLTFSICGVISVNKLIGESVVQTRSRADDALAYGMNQINGRKPYPAKVVMLQVKKEGRYET